MKKILLCILSICYLNVYSQQESEINKEITFDFNKGLESIRVKQEVLLSTQYDSCVKFPGESFIVLEQIEFPKELKFQYQYLINSGRIVFTVSIRKVNSDNFTDLKKFVLENNPVNTSNMFDQIIPIPYVDEKVDVKFSTSYPDNSVGQFFLDNVSFVLYSKDELTEQARMEKYLVETAKFAYTQVINVKVKDFNDKLNLIKSEYVANVNQLRTLSYRANTLASLSKLIVFVNKRNQLSNPNNYSVFRDKIDIIKQQCDTVQANFLDRLIMDIKPKQFNEPVSTGENKKTGFSRVVQVLGDVGNILTGGTFKSVVNSIQGVVAATFSPAAISSRIPQLLTTINKGKPVFGLNPEYSSEKVNNLTQQGLKIQKVLYDFFDILNKDREDFTQIVSEFQYYSQNIDHLINEIDATRLKFFQLVNYDMQEDYYLTTFLDVDEKKVNELSENVGIYFSTMEITDSLATKTIPSDHIRKIEEADELNKVIITLLNDYKNHAADLRVLFSKVENDLNKENPFGIYKDGQLVNSQEQIFGDAFASYDKLRLEAKNDFTSLYNNLDKILR